MVDSQKILPKWQVQYSLSKGTNINKNCIYFLKHINKLLLLVLCPTCCIFINRHLILKQNWASPVSQQHSFMWQIYLDCYLDVKYFKWLYLLFGWVILYGPERYAEIASYCRKYFLNIITSFVRLNFSLLAKYFPQIHSILEKLNRNNIKMRR